MWVDMSSFATLALIDVCVIYYNIQKWVWSWAGHYLLFATRTAKIISHIAEALFPLSHVFIEIYIGG
jgi:hypothetical protein